MESESRQVLLIATVGGSPAPIATAILALRPARILFVCTQFSLASIDHENDSVPPAQDNSGVRQRLRSAGYLLDPGRWDPVILPDEQDLESAVEQLHRTVGPAVRSWTRRGNEFFVIADFTCGTKCMSVALGLAARVWPCTFEYVGGGQRDKGGVGVVVSGTEQVVYFRNPWDSLGYQIAEEASALFNSGNIAGAATLLEKARNLASDGPLKRALHTLSVWMSVYANWDLFEHQRALGQLEQARRDQHLLGCLFESASIQRMMNQLDLAERLLKQLSASEGPSEELVRDLVSNGERRFREGRYDDAVARFYRAAEALGQWKLWTQFGIQTNAVVESAVPEALRMSWKSLKGEGPWKIGLQDTHRLLYDLGDEAGKSFRSAGLMVEMADGVPSGGGVLTARNQSILAHGFRAVGRKDAEKLLRAVTSLLGASSVTLEFPRLEW